MPHNLVIRPVTAPDAPQLAVLLNVIIARGGTSALEEPFTAEALNEAMLTGPNVICCFVAEAPNEELSGFQALTRSEHLADGIGDIGTFTRVGRVQRGTGSLLFAATRAEAARKGLSEINATIRADNAGGLAFYSRVGFTDHSVHAAVPLRDGTLVDRISKRYRLVE